MEDNTAAFDAELSAQIARQIRARYRRCWTNAACSVRLLGERGQYVEGWVVVNRFHPIVIEHGWCEVDTSIVDPTYTPVVSHLEPPLAYFAGMRFSATEAEAGLDRGKLPIAWLRSDAEYGRAFYRAWADAGQRWRHEARPRTRVVHCRKEPSDIFIGRPSQWANPYHIGPDGTREQVVAKYREWLIRQPRLLREIRSLRGRTLGCACAPLPCHGDVLAELADLGCSILESARPNRSSDAVAI
ncbi:MAG TPA: DUF4326 domain-containing protein [Terriglobales bacterium]|nr:DUF4326 domain-containing protein [Terriglobales bacterium]